MTRQPYLPPPNNGSDAKTNILLNISDKAKNDHFVGLLHKMREAFQFDFPSDAISIIKNKLELEKEQRETPN